MIRFLFFTIIIFTFSSCNDWLGDNKNPNMLSDAPVDALLTSSIEQTASIQFQLSLTTSLYAQYLASPNASEIDRYGRVTLDDVWTSLYLCMADANDLYLAANKENDFYHAGAGLILLSYNALVATDLWGDVPFSQAFKSQLILHPTYQSQESIYDTIVSNLNHAIYLLQQPNPFRVLSGDILYNNKPAAWRRFAFALKARTLIHLSKKTNFNTSDVLACIDSSFITNADGAALNYAGTKINPWYNLVNSLKTGGILNGYLSSQFIESLKGTNQIGMPIDSRITAITDTLKGAKYFGTTNGTPPPSSGFCTLTYNSWQAKKTAPIILLSYSELKSIEAEAAFYINDKSRAYNAYLQSITSNFTTLNISKTKTDAYIANTKVSVGKDSLKLAHIQYQKWIALFLQPEGWTDVRRNDYAYFGMQVPTNNLTNNIFIQRILYPNSEYSYNSENVPLNTSVTEKLWWNIK